MKRFRFFKLRLLTLLILILSGARPAVCQTDAGQVIAIGRNVLSMEDYMLAIHYFNQAIKAKPYLAEPYYLRGLAKLQLEDYAGAIADCSAAIERNKFLPEAYRLRGFARQSAGQDSLAVEDYDTGLEYNPQDRYFLFYKGIALTELKRFEKADSTLAALLRLYPQMDEGFTARARLNVLRGDTTAALADIERSIALSGGTTLQPWLLRADIEVKRADWSAALADMDQALRIRPEEADYYLNRAYIRYNNDDYFGAMADYNYTLELEPERTDALFNRGLLRYEVSDLDNAALDFAKVLEKDAANFHARYNLGLVNLERRRYREALSDFQTIAKRYPRFHPAYYAIGEAYRGMGNMRGAMTAIHQADEIVRAYTRNPEKNPLDRPTIQQGRANDRSGNGESEDEGAEEVMDRFNQLVVSSNAAEPQLAYNERIKGRVQDRNLDIDPEPAYMLTLSEAPESLQAATGWIRELEDFNSENVLGRPLKLAGAPGSTPEEYESLFAMEQRMEEGSRQSTRAADWFALGVVRSMLKDFEGARRALDRAIELYPDFTLAYLERGYATASDRNPEVHTFALADYDRALKINPRLGVVWHNKGNVYSSLSDWTSALDAYTKAVALDPNLGAAYYNRALVYLHLGNRQAAFADLRHAGELGVVPSYSLMKRMK